MLRVLQKRMISLEQHYGDEFKEQLPDATLFPTYVG
jgi:hypothetical protein